MNVLFIGSAIAPERSARTPGSSPAANRYQHGLLGGLAAALDGELRVVSRLPIAAGRSSGALWVRAGREEVRPGVVASILPMLNLPFVKQLCLGLGAARAVARFCRDHRGEQNVVLGYSLSSFVASFAARAARRAGPPLVYLYTDPPYAQARHGALWSMAYRLNRRMTERVLAQCAGLVTVNAHAVDVYAPGKPFLVLEGGVEAGAPRMQAAVQPLTLLYSGGYSPHNGLENLIAGFRRTENPGYRLQLYGRGVLEDDLRRQQAADPRIQVMGFAAPEAMPALQAGAAALVNPRPTAHSITATTFPSKLMEYLLSGRPVLTTRINGITADYDPYFHYVDDESPEGWAAAIDGLLGGDAAALDERGAAGRAFVLLEKNWDAHGQRLVAFLQQLTGERP